MKCSWIGGMRLVHLFPNQAKILELKLKQITKICIHTKKVKKFEVVPASYYSLTLSLNLKLEMPLG